MAPSTKSLFTEEISARPNGFITLVFFFLLSFQEEKEGEGRGRREKKREKEKSRGEERVSLFFSSFFSCFFPPFFWVEEEKYISSLLFSRGGERGPPHNRRSSPSSRV